MSDLQKCLLQTQLQCNAAPLRFEQAENSDADPISVVDQVFSFQQPNFLEIILDLAIRDDRPAVRKKTLHSVRLVQKSWHQAILNLYQTQNKCLYRVRLDENSLDEENDKGMNKFVSQMESRLEEAIPPTSITISYEFFRENNYDGLISLFTTCGSGILEMEIVLSHKGGSLPGIFSNKLLPSLKHLKVLYTEFDLYDVPGSEKFDKANNILFVTSILTHNNTIETVEFDVGDEDPCFHQLFEYLLLPNNLRNLTILFNGMRKSLALLSRNELLCLQQLTLRVSNTDEIKDTTFFQVVSKLRGCLQTLSFQSSEDDEPSERRYRMRFPVMSKLESLKLDSDYLELETGGESVVKYFPQLNTLHLNSQTKSMFDKWVNSKTCFVKVDTLSLSIVKDQPNGEDENRQYEDSDTIAEITVEQLKSVKISFPNLTKLELALNVRGEDFSALEYIFQNLPQLSTLKLRFVGVEQSTMLDSVFTGIPEDVSQALKIHPEFWEHLKVGNGVTSIKKLHELKSLELSCDYYIYNIDFCFEFAFLHMPGLLNVHLLEGFKVGDLVRALWKSMGRKLRHY